MCGIRSGRNLVVEGCPERNLAYSIYSIKDRLEYSIRREIPLGAGIQCIGFHRIPQIAKALREEITRLQQALALIEGHPQQCVVGARPRILRLLRRSQPCQPRESRSVPPRRERWRPLRKHVGRKRRRPVRKDSSPSQDCESEASFSRGIQANHKRITE
jgi:hypothetical protein